METKSVWQRRFDAVARRLVFQMLGNGWGAVHDAAVRNWVVWATEQVPDEAAPVSAGALLQYVRDGHRASIEQHGEECMFSLRYLQGSLACLQRQARAVKPEEPKPAPEQEAPPWTPGPLFAERPLAECVICGREVGAGLIRVDGKDTCLPCFERQVESLREEPAPEHHHGCVQWHNHPDRWWCHPHCPVLRQKVIDAMPAPTVQTLIDAAHLKTWGSFAPADFGCEGEPELNALLAGLCADASAQVRDRIGDGLYDAARWEVAGPARNGELALGLALAHEKRLAFFIDAVQEDAPDADDVAQTERQIARYRARAEELLAMVTRKPAPTVADVERGGVDGDQWAQAPTGSRWDEDNAEGGDPR